MRGRLTKRKRTAKPADGYDKAALRAVPDATQHLAGRNSALIVISTTFGFFARRSQRLARLISRKSHHFVPRPSFGLRTRKVATSSRSHDQNPAFSSDPHGPQVTDCGPRWHLMAPSRHRAKKKGTQRDR